MNKLIKGIILFVFYVKGGSYNNRNKNRKIYCDTVQFHSDGGRSENLKGSPLPQAGFHLIGGKSSTAK